MTAKTSKSSRSSSNVKSDASSSKSGDEDEKKKKHIHPSPTSKSLRSASSESVHFPTLKKMLRTNSKEQNQESSQEQDKVKPQVHIDQQMQDVFKNQGLMNTEMEQPVAWVDTERFNLVIGIIVALNCIVIGIDTDVNSGVDGRRPGVEWQVVDTIFAVIWVSEVMARLYYHKCRYFCNAWNNLDFFLACLAVVDAWVMKVMEMDSSAQATESFSWYRVIRIARMLRLLRLIKLMRMIQDVWLIIQGFLAALRTLLWVFVLLFLCIYSCAVYITTIVGQACNMDYRQKGIEFEDCEALFGTVPNSMLSLFQVITLDAWCEVIARSVGRGKPYLYVFFLVFLFFTTFGLLNIVVGVIVENTLHISDNNKKLQAQRQEARLRKELEALREVFEEADTDQSGGVDIEEFHEVMQREDVQQLFSEMELPCNEPDTLYEIFDVDKVGVLSIQRFVDGAIAFKGPPTGMEMRSMTLDVKGLATKVEGMENLLKTICSVPPSDVETSSNQVSSSLPGLQRQHTQGSLRSADALSAGALSGGALSGGGISETKEEVSSGVKQRVPSMDRGVLYPVAQQSAAERLDLIEETLKGVWSDQETLSAEFDSLLRFTRPIAKRIGIDIGSASRTSPVNGVHAVNGFGGTHHNLNGQAASSKLVSGLNPVQEQEMQDSPYRRGTRQLMQVLEANHMELQRDLERTGEILRKSRPVKPSRAAGDS
eukprot:gnl/MRDRNA2_/MRDRNA2_84003_c0_seq3.p1 gnl/MRDRNA2_/MRDRNA2_84003_c0~~gnl/MRDRNA2_/MRDRNA2_84003_c0_seq3.p1  ORF type:complete len:710 (+),score=133.45 gnl/MRDRNA2_/MRDRNA2_84003_c0_seq3:78-2207(+)